MVKQSGKSALNVNVYDVLGGMAETDVPCIDGNYFHYVLYKELQEEGGIERNDVNSCVLNMVFAGTHGHYGFYFDVELKKTAYELLERHQDNTDIDIESLHTYTYDQYLNGLENHFSPNKKLFAKYLKGKLRAD